MKKRQRQSWYTVATGTVSTRLTYLIWMLFEKPVATPYPFLDRPEVHIGNGVLTFYLLIRQPSRVFDDWSHHCQRGVPQARLQTAHSLLICRHWAGDSCFELAAVFLREDVCVFKADLLYEVHYAAPLAEDRSDCFPGFLNFLLLVHLELVCTA